jgi:signal transduction histidine kinase/ligand-binding sensor domain-containing protein
MNSIQSAVDSWQWADGYRQLVIPDKQRRPSCFRLPVAYCQLLIVYCLLLTAHCTLPTANSYAQQFPVANYNTSHGLINNRTGTAAQDAAGYMWFGTDNGICNYDGRSFHFFPGIHRQYYFAHSYYSTYGDSVLFSTNGQGIVVCYKNTAKFITFPGYENLGINSVLAVGKDSFLLACVNQGIKLLHGSKLMDMPLPPGLQQQLGAALIIFRDSHQNIWIGNEKGLLVFVKSDLSKPVYLELARGQWINAIKEDRDGNIYIVANPVIYRYDAAMMNAIANSKAILFYKDVNDFLSTINFDRSGNIYIGSQFRKGLLVFNKQKELLASIRPENGLAATIVWDIFFDRENNGWICTENGVSKFNHMFFRNYPVVKNDYPNFKSAVSLDDSTVLVNNADNFNLIINDEMKTISYTGLPAVAIGYMENMFYKTRDGKLWMNIYSNQYLTEGHTYETQLKRDRLYIGKPARFDGKSITGKLYMIDCEQACHDKMGRDFFLDQVGALLIYENARFHTCKPGHGSETVNHFTAIACDQQNNIWLYSVRHGLFQAQVRKEGDEYIYDLITAFPRTSAKYNSDAKLLIDHRDRVWLAAAPYDGIHCYTKNKDGRYVDSDSLPSQQFDNNYIRELAMDDAGFLYVGTNFGIYRVDTRGDKPGRVDRDVFGQYLTGKYIYFLHYQKDKLYIGTTGSVATVSLSNIDTDAVSPLIFITGFAVNNKNADSLLHVPEVKLSPGQNTVSFTFTSPTFINEQKIAYKYYLEGVDKEWSAPTIGYTATYSNLNPGTYTLKVLAQNANGDWSSRPAEFSFTIRAPFYKQWWFVVLCILALASIMYSLYRMRLAKILAVERTRQKISKDLHDDVGSALSSITLMNAVLKKKIVTNPDDAVNLAEKVEETSREMIQNMSDIVWSINPGNDGLEKLQARLQQFAGAIFEPRNIQYKLVFPKEMTERFMSMELRKDIYLVCKEIMNNAAKYSQATQFNLVISLQKNKLEIKADDNGKGFDMKNVKKGNGLNNIEQRVTNHEGIWELESDDKGTRWRIVVDTDNRRP